MRSKVATDDGDLVERDGATVLAQRQPRPARPGRPFERVLIANRGEIAVRLIRACRELGIEAIAVYSDADAEAMHVALADRSINIGPSAATESYLRIDRIIDAARMTGAQAIHPGYGFLAERASFAEACEEAGIAFVGPSSIAIAALGDKLEARRAAASVGVASVPGTLEAIRVDGPDDAASAIAVAMDIGFPILVKAAAGGGGRGMRRVEGPDDLPAALAAGSAEAAAAFGDGSVYLERVIEPARHVEVQLLGDSQGTIVAIGERDCSIQRRHQKLVEESPAPRLSADARRRLHELAVRVANRAGLRNAATAEFLVDADGEPWFLEVNTRLQVEHGVTELVTGLDLVVEQLWIAAGEPLSDAVLAAAANAVQSAGHAIEVRLSAEDPSRAFAATPGRLSRWVMPAGPGVRVDTGLRQGDSVRPEYDNLMAKIMVHAGDRPAAIARLARALDELEIGGVQTTLPFHRFIARDPAFAAGSLSTAFVGEHWQPIAEAERRAALDVARHAAIAAAEAPGAPERWSHTSGSRIGPSRADGQPAASAWRRAGHERAIDRWPR